MALPLSGNESARWSALGVLLTPWLYRPSLSTLSLSDAQPEIAASHLSVREISVPEIARFESPLLDFPVLEVFVPGDSASQLPPVELPVFVDFVPEIRAPEIVVFEPPSSEDFIPEAPVSELPVLEAPVLEATILEASVLEASILEASILEAPVLEAPVPEAPVLELLIPGPQVFEAPVPEVVALPEVPVAEVSRPEPSVAEVRVAEVAEKPVCELPALELSQAELLSIPAGQFFRELGWAGEVERRPASSPQERASELPGRASSFAINLEGTIAGEFFRELIPWGARGVLPVPILEGEANAFSSLAEMVQAATQQALHSARRAVPPPSNPSARDFFQNLTWQRSTPVSAQV